MEHTPQNATPDEVGSDLLNPFAKRSKLSRSPIRSATPAMTTSSTTSVPRKSTESKKEEDSAFVSLGRLINDLTAVIGSGKRSINQSFRDLAKAIAASYDQAAEELNKEIVTKSDSKQSQTTPSLSQLAKLQPTKCTREHVTGFSQVLQSLPMKQKKIHGISTNDTIGLGEAAITKEKPAKEYEKWTTVTKQKRHKIKPARPDAIIVKSTGECSYAEILKAVKSEDSLKGMNTMVRKIRKTVSGDLLFQLTKPSDANTEKLRAAVGQLLTGKAEVKSLTEECLVDIHDIDEVTTMEEIYLALKSQIRDIEISLSSIRTLRKAYGGTQIATISLPSEVAKKLLGEGKIRIGWVICRIRAKIQPRRCFKCLDFGHTSRNCSSENDYKSRCFKCGEEGHTAKLCTKAPRCLLCTKRGTGQTDHHTGGTKCPVYQAALKKLKSL